MIFQAGPPCSLCKSAVRQHRDECPILEHRPEPVERCAECKRATNNHRLGCVKSPIPCDPEAGRCNLSNNLLCFYHH